MDENERAVVSRVKEFIDRWNTAPAQSRIVYTLGTNTGVHHVTVDDLEVLVAAARRSR